MKKKKMEKIFLYEYQKADKFIDENHKDIVMGSVACSIWPESAAIDKVRWF